MEADGSGRELLGTLDVLKRLREQWMLVIALVSALFMARDLAEVYVRLPGDVRRQAETVAGLGVRVTGLEDRIGHVEVAGSAPGQTAPSTLSGRLEGRAGSWTTLGWHSAAALDPDCALHRADAVLVDTEGSWHALELHLERASVSAREGLAFRVRLHPRMELGLARVRVRVLHRCRGVDREESSPWTPFVLLIP